MLVYRNVMFVQGFNADDWTDLLRKQGAEKVIDELSDAGVDVFCGEESECAWHGPDDYVERVADYEGGFWLVTHGHGGFGVQHVVERFGATYEDEYECILPEEM